ncbi:MAG: DUF87 domain-containing protein [Chloroflexi bacterium]|nr:DUF87 domain-containing protein [Chloroflexota bacterium]
MAVATEERVEREGYEVRGELEGTSQGGQNGVVKRGARVFTRVGGRVAGVTAGAAGRLLRLRGSEDDDGVIPAHIDPDLEERERQAEMEREWPSDNLDEVPDVLGYLGYSHIENGNRIVRADRRKMVVFQVKGQENDEASVRSFAGALNSLQGQVQFLIRQHPPRLNEFRLKMREQRQAAEGEKPLSGRLRMAAESLDVLLGDMESREGLMDRRFYIICDAERMDEVMAAVSRVQLTAGVLADRALDILLLSCAFGQSPADLPEQESIRYRTEVSHVRSDNGDYRKTIWLKVFPRQISLGFLESILTQGIPMDVSVQVSQVPSAQALSNLQSQLTKMQASATIQLKRKGIVDEKEKIAIEDIVRLRSQVMRGVERMFNVCLAVTVHAPSERKLEEYLTVLRSVFTSVMAQLEELPRVQAKALRLTMPLCENSLRKWTVVDTSSVALLYPFGPPDMDARDGTLIGLDTNARSLVTFDKFNSPVAQNLNTAILATSGAGKSYSAKLGILRQLTRGVRAYIVDPEGEYVDTAIAAGGRVLTPGVPGQGMNPFVVAETGAELMERIQNLINLVQVMIGQNLDPTLRASLDNAMTTYYERVAAEGEEGNWSGLYGHLEKTEPALAAMVRPFYSGSMRYLLSDEGTDLLTDEPPITVFNLRLIKPEMSAAAAMVCAEVVWTMAARDPRPRELIVDEVWRIIQVPEGAEFMMNTAKRARKHVLGLTSITQDVNDLLAVNTSEGVRGNSGRAVIQNASYKLLLRQDPAVVGTIADTFQLPRELAEQLPSYPTGQGLLLTPMGRFPVEMESAPMEHEIIEWEAGSH